LLPNPSGRPATAATRFEPARGAAKTLATRFVGTGKESDAVPEGAKPKSALRWPDYVLRGAAAVMAAVFVVRLFIPTEKAKEAPAPPAAVDDAAERNLPALAKDADAVWKRVELVLRRLGHVTGPGTASISDLRTGLKAYQGAVGHAKTGTLDQDTLNRVLDETVELEPYNVSGAIADGRWFYEQDAEGCRMTTGATRIEGRVMSTGRPVMEFGRKRKYAPDDGDTGDTITVSLIKTSLFDTSIPISMNAGSERQILKLGEEDDIVMGDTPEGVPTRDVTRMLRRHQGDVVISGASAFGGVLKVSFSTDGFEKAYRAMAAECGEGILYWIDDWAAVAKDKDASLWHVDTFGTEQTAKDKAMEECKSKSSAGGCFEYASFKNQCFVLTAGQQRKNYWISGWATDPDLEAAKKQAFESCAKEGGKDCELILHFCADGSEQWSAPRDE
jgi:hypothetical protein